MYLRLGCFLLLALFAVSGCVQEDVERMRPLGDISLRVGFEVLPEEVESKSSLSVSETGINDIALFVYEKGIMVSSYYSKTASSISLKLRSGRAYTVYAVANAGDIQMPVNENEVENFRLQIPDMKMITHTGMPMAGSRSFELGTAPLKVRILIRRAIARIRFSADTSSLPGFRITSVRLMNVPSDIALFSYGSMAFRVMDGDYATPLDIDAVNSGGSADLYMLENCQGVLLPDNKDPWAKIPENLPASIRDLCTYIEVKAVLDGSLGVEGPVVYRFYLGRDLTSDFSIGRNTENNVKLVTTAAGLDSVSWRIDTSGLKILPVPVILASSGGYVYSTDKNGILNTMIISPHTWNEVKYLGGKYIAVGDDGATAVSDDGVRWTYRCVEFIPWYDVAYGMGRYVLAGGYHRPVSSMPDSPYRYFGCVATSEDAELWTVSEEGDCSWTSVVFGVNGFLMSGETVEWDTSLSDWYLSSSPDGKVWSSYNYGSRQYMSLYAYDNEYIALSLGNYIYSEDGKVWSENHYGEFENIVDIAWDGKRKYVAVGTFGAMAFSSDCRNWEKAEAPDGGRWTSVDYANGRFVAAGYNGAVAYSADGRKWHMLDLGITRDIYSVCVKR